MIGTYYGFRHVSGLAYGMLVHTNQCTGWKRRIDRRSLNHAKGQETAPAQPDLTSRFDLKNAQRLKA